MLTKSKASRSLRESRWSKSSHSLAQPFYPERINFTVEIKDKANALRVLRDIWKHDRRSNWHFSKNCTTCLSIGFLFKKIELRKFNVALSNNQKVDESIMYFQFLHFSTQCLKDLHIKNAKMNNTRCLKNVPCKYFRALKKANRNRQDIRTTSKLSYLNCKSWGLVTIDWNIKKKVALFRPKTRRQFSPTERKF